MHKPKENLRRIYVIFIWHGAFLALTMAMIDFNTVLPSLFSNLTHSKLIFGFIYAILLGAPVIFNLFFSRYLQNKRQKRPFLLGSIYLRSLAFLLMAIFTYRFGAQNPSFIIFSFFIWIFLFAASGGFAGLAYTDIVGKLVAKGDRSKLYAAREFAGGIAALGGSFIVGRVFTPGFIPFPVNYAILFLIGFGGLIIASGAFWFIDEPPSTMERGTKASLLSMIKEIPGHLKANPEFARFILVENLTSFSLMVLPFYMIFAKDVLKVDQSFIGRYLIFSVVGTIISNIFWGFIAQKNGSKAVVRNCIFLGGLIPVLAILISMFGPDWFALVFLLIGFIQSGREVGFDPYLLDITPDEKRTVFLGIRGTLNLLIILMPILGGMFIDIFGYYTTFGLVTLVMMSSFMILSFGKSVPEVY